MAEQFPFAMNPVQPGGIMDQLNTFLENRDVRAGMMAAGGVLMQPPQWGQNFTAQLGSALGAAGEAGRNLEAQDIKRGEAESKQALRESQAYAAEARAGAAGARAGAATDRLSLEQFRQESLNKRHLANIRATVMKEYNREIKAIADRNMKGSTDLLQRGKFKPETIPTEEEFVRQRSPSLMQLLSPEERKAIGEDDESRPISSGARPPASPAATTPTRPLTGADGKPIPKEQLIVGERYPPGVWTGTGFRRD